MSIQMPLTQQSENLKNAFNESQPIDQNYLLAHASGISENQIVNDEACKQEYFS